MIKFLKRLWLEWRLSVALTKVKTCGFKRLVLKEKQLEYKKVAGDLEVAIKNLK